MDNSDNGNEHKGKPGKKEVAVIIKQDPVCLLRSGSSHVMKCRVFQF